MLKVELACQEFDRETGLDGKTVWPIDVSEEQLTEVMQITTVWTPNTRKSDQLEGVAVWALRDPLLLQTVLKSWARRKPWVNWFLACLETDKDLKRGWELHMAWSEEIKLDMGETQELPLLCESDIIELTDIVELRNIVESDRRVRHVDADPDFVLLPGSMPDKKAHREWLKDHMLVRRMFDHIHSALALREEEREVAEEMVNPFPFDDEEMEIILGNIGQEDQLW